jgi:glucose-6-phosphate isomerase
MVESKEAVILSVSRYDLNNRFPLEVLLGIKESMHEFETWIQRRATELMKNEY